MNYKRAVLVLMGVLPGCVLAMQPLDDTGLAQATGQDGIDISLSFPNSVINYDQIALIDKDGITGATSPASVVIAPNTFTSSDGIQLLTSANAAVTNPIKITMDADKNGTAPVANIGIAMPSDLAKINITGFSIYLAPDANNVFTARRVLNGANLSARSAVRTLLTVNPVQILFGAGNAPKINIQLGNQPQGHMLLFTAGAIQQVYTPLINLVSLNSGTPVNLAITDFTVSANGYPSNSSAVFNLSGFYADLVGDSLVFGKTGATDKFDLTIGSIKAGTASSSTVFAGLANGSMGGLGVIGASVTDLKVNVKGL